MRRYRRCAGALSWDSIERQWWHSLNSPFICTR
jgi:hypothetical protein